MSEPLDDDAAAAASAAAAGSASRPWLRLSLLALLALPACAVLIAELSLRARIHPPEDPAFPFAQPPLAELRVRIARDLPGLPAREVAFTTNALGLRGRDLALDDHSELRVLTLGDSVTECLLLSDEDAWPAQLERELASRLSRPVWVGNAARSGELVADYLTHMKRLVPALAPDLVVIVVGGHDFQAALEDALMPVSLDDPARLRAHAAKLYSSANLEGLSPSYLLFALERRPEHLDMTDFYERMRARREQAQKRDSLDDLEDALDLYRASLKALVRAHAELGEEHAPKLVLATHPSLWRAELSAAEQEVLWGGYTCMECDAPNYYAHGALAQGIRAFNDALLALCEERGLACLDLDRIVDKSLESFYDDAHMREQGATKTARALADFIAARGLVP